MADREKVIKALECCYCNFPKQMDCNNCPYDKICYHDKACSLMLRDALALLKEQETQKFFVDESGKITPLPVIVRCKDCKQGEQSVLPNRHLWCRIHEFYREPEWYCADGERKSD